MHINKRVNSCEILIFILLAANELIAFDDYMPLERPYRSVRAMGMGNAFGAVADDGDAFYYNPAGLASINKIRFECQPAGFILTRDLRQEAENLEQLIDDIDAINKSSEPLEDPALADERLRLMERMKTLTEENLGLDTANPVRLIIPLSAGDYAISIGGIVHAWSQSQIQVQQVGLRWGDFAKGILNDQLFYNIIGESSYGVAAAIETPVYPLPLEVSFGISVRRIHRWQLTDKYDPLGLEDLIQLSEEDFKKRYFDPEDPLGSLVESTGYKIDVGSIITFRDAISIGAVLQNVPGKIKKEDIPRNSEISAAINLANLSVPAITSLDIILAGTIDLDNDTQEDIINRSQFGIEIIWKLPSLALSGRAGSNHSFLTLGAGIQFLFLDLDYAFYGDFDTDWHAVSLNLAF